MSKKYLFLILGITLIALISSNLTRNAKASLSNAPLTNYTYQVNPTDFTCGNVNPGAGVVKARAIPDNTNYRLDVELRKCDDSDFLLPSDLYIGVNNPIDFTFHDSPTGYSCGDSGNVEMDFITSETNPRFRTRKCASGGMNTWGQAQMYIVA